MCNTFAKPNMLTWYDIETCKDVCESDSDQRCSIYQRMQEVHWGVKNNKYNTTFWNIVDQKLEFLCQQSTRYQYVYVIFINIIFKCDVLICVVYQFLCVCVLFISFYVLVLYSDYDHFNG